MTVGLLPEDGARDAFDVLRHLVLHAARRLGVEVAARPIDLPWAATARAKRWENHRLAVDFARSLAGELTRREGVAVVVVHFDADCRWADREDRNTVAARFEKRVHGPLRKIDGAAAERLAVLRPHWELEAWAYRNLDGLRRLGREVPPGWEVPGALDELANPKDLHGDRHNLALVADRRWPAADAHADAKSFAAFLDALGVAVRAAEARAGRAGGW